MAGRANKYVENVAPRLSDIEEWSGKLTERKIAKRLGVSMASFQSYKNDHPELKEALRKGKTDTVTALREALFRKAVGFHYIEKRKTTKTQGGTETIIEEEFERYSAPDTGAAHLLLKNLDKDWRNDDHTTVTLKQERLNLEKEKAEDNNW